MSAAARSVPDIGQTSVQQRPVGTSRATKAPGETADRQAAVYRHQVAHDIRHELGTIMMLEAALMTSKDLGQESRGRVLQLIAESHWLDELIRAYDAVPGCGDTNGPVRLDELVTDIVRPIQLSGAAEVSVHAEAVSVQLDRLSLWRAVRNVLCNALDAAGPHGRLTANVSSVDGFAAIDFDDDGPGFEHDDSTRTSHGLSIVEEFVDSCGGRIEIGRSEQGGCRVRMLLPEHDAVQSGSVQRAHCAL
ncbi:MAG TPA: HAMP domain-containing sensor histidine kinase [Jatrophihabitantaceae bacterium]|nr:HAMP domain-containing sensor histidine kinase [Jatrophihabitantaceae bacterium]